MAVRSEFIVKLKNKSYPLFAGILDAATDAGLKSLTTSVVQIPTAENGNLAVVLARAEFSDGRVFEDIGDCSPASTSTHLVGASLRIASTRAKGRALRDAVNVGQTMFEELPDGASEATPAPTLARPPLYVAESPPVTCDEGDCGLILDKDEIKAAQKYAEAFHGGRFCKAHGKVMLDIWKAKQAGAPSVAAIVAALPPDPFADEE